MPFQPGNNANPHGRPPGPATRYAREVKAAADLMGASLIPATRRLVDLALGTHVLMLFDAENREWRSPRSLSEAKQHLKRGGLFRVYVEPPDLRAILAVQDRSMGKVPAAVNIEVRQVIEDAVDAQATLARIIEERVPPQYLAPVLADLRRVRNLAPRTRAALDTAGQVVPAPDLPA